MGSFNVAWHDAEKLRHHQEVDAYLADLDDVQRSICEQVRERVKQDPDVLEFIAWGVPCYWGKGPLLYTSAAKHHVTLGFFRGMEIGSGLKGTGKSPVAKFVWKLGQPMPEGFEQWLEGALALDDAGED